MSRLRVPVGVTAACIALHSAQISGLRGVLAGDDHASLGERPGIADLDQPILGGDSPSEAEAHGEPYCSGNSEAVCTARFQGASKDLDELQTKGVLDITGCRGAGSVPNRFCDLSEEDRFNQTAEYFVGTFGAYVSPKIKFTDNLEFGGGSRGFYTTEPTEKSEVLLKVVDGMFLHYGQAKSWLDSAGVDLPTSVFGEFAMTNVVLGLLLLRERQRGDDSIFAGYVSLLPACPSVYCMPRKEIEEATGKVGNLQKGSLTNRNFQKMFLNVWDQAFDMADTIAGSLPYERMGCQPFSAAEIVWATGMVASRSFGKDDDLVLTPLADMPNHSHDAFLVSVEETGKVDERLAQLTGLPQVREDGYSLQIVSHKALEAGQEVFLKYHDDESTDLRFLLCYGFVPEVNPWRDYELVVGARAPLFRQHLERNGITNSARDKNDVQLSQRLYAKSLPPPSFFGFVRGLVFSDMLVADLNAQAQGQAVSHEELLKAAQKNLTEVVTPNVLQGREFISLAVEQGVSKRIMKWLQHAAKAEGVYLEQWSREFTMKASDMHMSFGQHLHGWLLLMEYYFRENLHTVLKAIEKLQTMQEEHAHANEVLAVIESIPL